MPKLSTLSIIRILVAASAHDLTCENRDKKTFFEIIFKENEKWSDNGRLSENDEIIVLLHNPHIGRSFGTRFDLRKS